MLKATATINNNKNCVLFRQVPTTKIQSNFCYAWYDTDNLLRAVLLLPNLTNFISIHLHDNRIKYNEDSSFGSLE